MMKTILSCFSGSSRSNFLFSAYLLASFALLYGIQEFLFQSLGIVLIEEVVGLVKPMFQALYEMAGWTLIGFIPMGLVLFFCTVRKLTSTFLESHQSLCAWINELAVALGLIGTIHGFIVVASNGELQSGSISAAHTLSAILVGMGSTFVGIILALWAILLQSPNSR